MRIFHTLFSVVLVLLFCQLPSFSKQYAIRLEAHLAELIKVKDAFSSSFFRQKVEVHAEYSAFLEKRYENFQKACERLSSSNPIWQPLWMVWGFDSEIMKETWQGYTPGFFFTTASLVWGLFGALTGELMLLGLTALFRYPRKNGVS